MNMKHIHKIAAILAFIIGTMTIIAGSRVLLEIDTKDYNVLNWLVVYNIVLGIISLIAAYIIWQKHRLTKTAIVVVLTSHVLIQLYLNLLNENVTSQSINAMTFRIGIWSIIALIITLNSKTQ